MSDPLDLPRDPLLDDSPPSRALPHAPEAGDVPAGEPTLAASPEEADDGSGAPATGSGAPATSVEGESAERRRSYVFLGVVAGLSLALDLWSKAWAERRLDAPDAYFHPVVLIKDHLDFVLAKNRGGAWGLLQDTPEYVRRPFFLLVSALAITFIVSLYRRLGEDQWAMRWGLPLVLGGALGNLVDRIRYSHVIDFIHAHASWGGRDHSWPTFNVADIAICVGVGLMAIDMFTSPNPSAAKTANAP